MIILIIVVAVIFLVVINDLAQKINKVNAAISLLNSGHNVGDETPNHKIEELEDRIEYIEGKLQI